MSPDGAVRFPNGSDQIGAFPLTIRWIGLEDLPLLKAGRLAGDDEL